MEPFRLPSFELLENAEAWLAVFESVNLYDAELRAVRIDLERSQNVEIDLYLPGEFAMAVPVDRRAEEYCITVKCTGVSAVRAQDISRQNIVGEYGFDVGESADARIFWLKGTVGCDLEIHCHRIAVAQVVSRAPAA
jgi:hypothetical protein